MFSKSFPDTAVIADVATERDVRGLVATVGACTLVFALTACVRFLGLVGFTNDQYTTLAAAQQMLFGEWPTRDFVDFGAPLAYATSAAAELIFGRNLFAEAILTAAAFALAAALTLLAVKRLSGSIIVAIVAALVEVAIFPRGYAYPKILLYAAAPLLIWWYQDEPLSLTRMAVVAIFVQIAFLFRHDHGLYIGAGAFVAAVLGDGRPEWRRGAGKRAALFSLLALAAALPYVVYVSVNGGVLRYLVGSIGYSAAEAADNDLIVPPFGLTLGVHRNSEAFLFYLFYLLPVIAVVVLYVTRERRDRAFAYVVPLVVIALLADRGFLRDYLETRLADAIVTPVLLFAWLCAQIEHIAAPRRRATARGFATVTAFVGVFTVTTVGDTGEQLNRASLFGGLRRMPERFVERSEELHERFNIHQVPAGPVPALGLFFDYVDRCTTRDERLLLPGFIPEVAVYAQRPFAGGRSTILPGYIDTTSERQRLMARIAMQRVLFVVVTGKFKDPVWRAYPELAAYVAEHYRQLVTYGPEGDRRVEVYVNHTLRSTSVDSATGWPCFR